ncbi:ABC transporter substrate-binding protein [Micromonospora endolithica]|uniref:Extracellular solute-binding protein n=1 Tax=Micromonospora endolithica TaxID=230091 RepID=A0A3A9YUI9_9ACTN|nr:extracellular solute-binding protein [Micromonospora endolithica]RKN39645.1 extracellular solute-binding protein [Micromonospora endolithica]TWJ22214.1 carbohydrate ABC transporter substrate-binding protein, CUT1 family (TC 3.A.1.1.-) [Micromonospora endolithica]
MHPATPPTHGTMAVPVHRTPVPRRRLLRRLLAAAVAVPLLLGGAVACGGDDEAGSDGKVELSIFWWGGEARAQLTEQALALYTEKNPNVTFKKTWQANQGYFDKLATLTAGGNPPDIFQIDDNFLTEYAARNTTLDLTEYKDNGKLDVSKFPESLWQYGVVDGKLAGLAAGENTQGLVYNKTLLTKNGLPEPTTGMSWEEHIAWAEQVAKKTKVPGTMDASAVDKAFWVWLRQQGKDLYKGNDLGFTVEDVTKWFELWKGARDRGATPTPDVIHEGNATDITKQLVVTGKAGTSWVWVNQMPELKKNTKDELGVVAYPGDPGAQWARAAMYWSVFRGSKHKDAAVDVLNFLSNDPEAVKLLGTDRGLPSNLELRDQVSQSVTDPAMKQSIEVETKLAETFGAAPQVPIKGHSKVRAELTKAAEEAQYGRLTPAQAAEQFYAACKSAIA